MTDGPTENASAPETAALPAAPEPAVPPAAPEPAPAPEADRPTEPEPDRPPRQPNSADVRPHMPEYKGGDLDSERGPGLGCFWFQVGLLAFFLVLIPVGVNLSWPYGVLFAMMVVVLILLFFVGMTMIFLLRLVAADRRSTGGRRRPLSSATRTVGELEDAQAPAGPMLNARPVLKTVEQAEAERTARAAAIRATTAERAARRTVAASHEPAPDADGPAGSGTPGVRQ